LSVTLTKLLHLKRRVHDNATSQEEVRAKAQSKSTRRKGIESFLCVFGFPLAPLREIL
jgi:hypothetical protein